MLLFILGNHCFSQGGWDIGFLPIDSIDQDVVGNDVKLDFKNQSDTTKTIPKFLMNFIGLEDSVTILLDGKKIEFKEKRNIHLDWGFYDEQFLECTNYRNNETIRIYHSVIEEQNDDSILVRLYIEVYNRHRKGKKSKSTDRRYCESVWIPKEVLSGVMIKE